MNVELMSLVTTIEVADVPNGRGVMVRLTFQRGPNAPKEQSPHYWLQPLVATHLAGLIAQKLQASLPPAGTSPKKH